MTETTQAQRERFKQKIVDRVNGLHWDCNLKHDIRRSKAERDAYVQQRLQVARDVEDFLAQNGHVEVLPPEPEHWMDRKRKPAFVEG